ncbi:hypothetical protein CMUS01_10987 [Colletotrichum musicola]|uniref:Uncharacterized protein n=1 Tax=Colletotrichum musicola TaxID=2175873 RepID=A0A8H6K0Z7_9PEZI|nr:hypothetical protein CMUS01_10987 [Colletotrichum musicola]
MRQKIEEVQAQREIKFSTYRTSLPGRQASLCRANPRTGDGPFVDTATPVDLSYAPFGIVPVEYLDGDPSSKAGSYSSPIDAPCHIRQSFPDMSQGVSSLAPRRRRTTEGALSSVHMGRPKMWFISRVDRETLRAEIQKLKSLSPTTTSAAHTSGSGISGWDGATSSCLCKDVVFSSSGVAMGQSVLSLSLQRTDQKAEATATARTLKTSIQVREAPSVVHEVAAGRWDSGEYRTSCLEMASVADDPISPLDSDRRSPDIRSSTSRVPLHGHRRPQSCTLGRLLYDTAPGDRRRT